MTPEIKEILRENRKTVIVLAVLFVVVIIALSIWIFKPGLIEKAKIDLQGGKVVEDKIIIPDTVTAAPSDAKIKNDSGYEVPLAPKSNEEKIIISQETISLGGSVDLALLEAKKWSEDAKLSFVKSLGTVTLTGESASWQTIFHSASKKKSYEIIVSFGNIASQKEIESNLAGGDLPKNLKDLKEIIKNLGEHPLYQGATMSGATLYFNPDNKKWYYSLSTSKGVSSVDAQ